MSVSPLSTRPSQQSQAPIVPYSWVAKILKVPVFRLALGDDLVSRIVIAVYSFFSRLCPGQNGSFRSFDPAKAARSIERFRSLGAQTQSVTPRDGRGRIQMMTFRAQDLERRIQELGGRWERRRIIENQMPPKQVFAIVPPENQGDQWLAFKEKLSHFRWRELDGMLITSECADLIPESTEKRCFLYAHSTSTSFASDWKRAGFYIGAKQDLCFFDNGNTWLNNGRPPSEGSFCLEAEAVYDQIQGRYAPGQIWVGGSCGGAPVAAYLKRLHHQEGVNFFTEQSFSDLDDFVKPISSFFAPRVKGSLSDQELLHGLDNPPPSCQFGVARLWELLCRSEAGKIIFVEVREDEHIGQEAYQRYLDVARRVNTNVTHLVYTSTARWRHADDFFNYPDPQRQFLGTVFN